MNKIYNVPILTAGGLVYDYNKPKKIFEDEFYLLVKTGFSFKPMANLLLDFYDK